MAETEELVSKEEKEEEEEWAPKESAPPPPAGKKMGEEKVEMKEVTEEVPLKDTEPNGDAKTNGKKKNPFTFFNRHKTEPKSSETTEEKAGERETVEEKKPKEPKKPRTWFWQVEKKAGVETEPKPEKETLSFGINMDDRDERGINDHVKLMFEDILAEPEGYHSFDCAWRLTFRVFTAVRSFFYKLLACLVALPCAILWGFVFALLTVLNVWACVPAARALVIPATWLAKVWNWVLRSVFDPCFRSCGLVWSSVHVRRTSEMAPPPLPTSDPTLLA